MSRSTLRLQTCKMLLAPYPEHSFGRGLSLTAGPGKQVSLFVLFGKKDYTPIRTLIKSIILISSWALYKQKQKNNSQGIQKAGCYRHHTAIMGLRLPHTRPSLAHLLCSVHGTHMCVHFFLEHIPRNFVILSCSGLAGLASHKRGVSSCLNLM